MYLTNRKRYSLRHSHFEVPLYRTKYGTRQLKCLIPTFPNEHPQVLVNVNKAQSASLFKGVVKSYLFSYVPSSFCKTSNIMGFAIFVRKRKNLIEFLCCACNELLLIVRSPVSLLSPFSASVFYCIIS